MSSTEHLAEAVALSQQRLVEALYWLTLIENEAPVSEVLSNDLLDVAYNCIWVASVLASVGSFDLMDMSINGLPDWVVC